MIKREILISMGMGWPVSFDKSALSVTVQVKPVQQYFRMVLFVVCAILTLESVDEMLWCYHSNVIS